MKVSPIVQIYEVYESLSTHAISLPRGIPDKGLDPKLSRYDVSCVSWGDHRHPVPREVIAGTTSQGAFLEIRRSRQEDSAVPEVDVLLLLVIFRDISDMRVLISQVNGDDGMLISFPSRKYSSMATSHAPES